MDTQENLTLEELNQLAMAYLDCRLSRLQEKELEYVLSCSKYSSPAIDEVRSMMAVSTLMSATVAKHRARRSKYRSTLLRVGGMVACMLLLLGVAVSLNKNVNDAEAVDLCVYVNGEKFSGETAGDIAYMEEATCMALLEDVIKETAYIESQSIQYINTITGKP